MRHRTHRINRVMTRAVGAATALGLAIGITPAAERGLSGKEIIAHHVEAVGGRKAVQEVRSFQVEGSYAIPAFGLEGTVKLVFARPDRLVFAVEAPGLSFAQGHDGETAWTVTPQEGNLVLGGARRDDVLRRALRGFSLLPDARIVASAESLGVEEFGGRPCHRVRLTLHPGGPEYTEFFDVETGLMAGRIETIHTAAGPVEMQGQASDYRRFGPLLIAARWTHNAGGQEWSAVYESVEFNTVDGEAFALPSEITAVVAGERSGAGK